MVILLKYEPQEAILTWNQHLKSWQKKKKKKKEKEKNFRPTDPNIFRHVSGKTGIFGPSMTVDALNNTLD